MTILRLSNMFIQNNKYNRHMGCSIGTLKTKHFLLLSFTHYPPCVISINIIHSVPISSPGMTGSVMPEIAFRLAASAFGKERGLFPSIHSYQLPLTNVYCLYYDRDNIRYIFFWLLKHLLFFPK